MSSAHGEVVTYYLSDKELEYYRNLPSRYDHEDRPKINWKWEREKNRIQSNFKNLHKKTT